MKRIASYLVVLMCLFMSAPLRADKTSRIASRAQRNLDNGKILKILEEGETEKAVAASEAVANAAAEIGLSGATTNGGASVIGQIMQYTMDAFNAAEELAQGFETTLSTIQLSESIGKYYDLANGLTQNWEMLRTAYELYNEYVAGFQDHVNYYNDLFSKGQIDFQTFYGLLNGLRRDMNSVYGDFGFIFDKEDGLFSKSFWTPEFRIQYTKNLINDIKERNARREQEKKNIENDIKASESGAIAKGILDNAFATSAGGKEKIGSVEKGRIEGQVEDATEETAESIYDIMKEQTQNDFSVTKESIKEQQSTKKDSAITQTVIDLLLMLEALLAGFFAVPAFIRMNSGERQSANALWKIVAGSIAMFIITIIVSKLLVPLIPFL